MHPQVQVPKFRRRVEKRATGKPELWYEKNADTRKVLTREKKVRLINVRLGEMRVPKGKH